VDDQPIRRLWKLKFSHRLQSEAQRPVADRVLYRLRRSWGTTAHALKEADVLDLRRRAGLGCRTCPRRCSMPWSGRSSDAWWRG